MPVAQRAPREVGRSPPKPRSSRTDERRNAGKAQGHVPSSSGVFPRRLAFSPVRARLIWWNGVIHGDVFDAKIMARSCRARLIRPTFKTAWYERHSCNSGRIGPQDTRGPTKVLNMRGRRQPGCARPFRQTAFRGSEKRPPGAGRWRLPSQCSDGIAARWRSSQKTSRPVGGHA